MFENRTDQPSPAEFMDAVRKTEKESRKNLAKGILVGALVGYALRRKS